MNLADEVYLLMEQLTAAWGNVRIECKPTGSEPDTTTCLVWDGDQGEGYLHAYEAPTLLEALRLAAASPQGKEEAT